LAGAASQRHILTQTFNSPPEKKHHGCLWGCLAAIILIALPAAGLAGYGGWLLYHGLTGDSGTRAVVEALQDNGVAEAVLGRDIRLAGVESRAVAALSGQGVRGVYVLLLVGSKGKGTATVTADLSGTHIHIVRAILIGPHGMRYDLLRQTMRVPEDSI
jgi:hypothetical protein